jgi:hypothetical protein
MAYGVVHDQVTARISLEYFTVGHPMLIRTNSPTILGLEWGVLGTLAGGLLVGYLLARCAVGGSGPPYPKEALCRSIAVLFCCMGLAAILAGLLGYVLQRHGWISLPEPYSEILRADRQTRFMAVWWAHGGSYLAAYAGAGIILWRVWKARPGRP